MRERGDNGEIKVGRERGERRLLPQFFLSLFVEEIVDVDTELGKV